MKIPQRLLRPWALSDLETLIQYANNPNVAQNLTDQFPHPYTRAHGQAFIEKAMAGNPTTIFAIAIDGAAVGGIGLHPQADIYRKNAELGYWLAEPYWGQGIMSKAIGEIVKIGFDTLDIDRIFARPFGTNVGSQKALEKNQFVLEGRFDQVLLKNGVYQDELVYAIRRNHLNTIGVKN